jgi:hypothetical protein
VAWQQQPASWQLQQQQQQQQAWQQHQACRPGSYPSGQFGITPASSMPQNNGQMCSSVLSAGSWQPAHSLVQQQQQQQQHQAQRPASQQAKPLPLHQQEAAIPGGTGSGTGFYPIIHAGSGEAGDTAAALALATPPLTPAVSGPAATAAGNGVLYPNLQQSSATTSPSLCGAPSSAAGYPSTQQLGAVCSAAAECSPITQPPGVAADSIATSTPTPQQPQAAAPWSVAVPPLAGDAAAKVPTGAAQQQQAQQPEQQESKVEAGGGTEAASSDGRWQEGSWQEAATGGEGSFEEAALLALLLGDAPSCPAAPAPKSGLSWQSATPFTAEASPFTASSALPLDHAPSAPLATKSFIARHSDSGSCGGGGDGTSSGGGAWQAWASTSCDEAAAAAAAYSTGAGDARLQQEVAAGQEAGSDSAALGLSTDTGTAGDGTASTGNGTGTGTGIDDGYGSSAAGGDKGDATEAAAAAQVDSSVVWRPELPDASSGESLQLASHQLQLLSLTASTTVSSRSETVAGGGGGSVPDSGSSRWDLGLAARASGPAAMRLLCYSLDSCFANHPGFAQTSLTISPAVPPAPCAAARPKPAPCLLTRTHKPLLPGSSSSRQQTARRQRGRQSKSKSRRCSACRRKCRVSRAPGMPASRQATLGTAARQQARWGPPLWVRLAVRLALEAPQLEVPRL